MKSYTDIEQSKKLAKILPIESADMYYSDNEYPKQITKYIITYANVLYGSYDIQFFNICEYVPCWSLAALLGVIPKTDLVQNSEEIWLVHSWVNAYPWSVGGYSNPIDACVAMIEKLHELKIL